MADFPPEVQTVTARLLALLGLKVRSGSVTLHISDGGLVQKAEATMVFRPEKLDTERRSGSG